MKLHFLGANRQVTGSKYCLEVNGSRVLIDCGLFQERPFEPRNWEPCPIPPGDIDAMLLTHAHTDHCGLIPRLVRQGLKCPIHCTPPTIPLTEVILRDSAHIQEEDLAQKLRRHDRQHRKHKYPLEPLFTEGDVDAAMRLFRPQPYRKSFTVVPGVTATFHDAGHILGSSMIEVRATENGETRSILFSGDIGQWDKPIINDPSLFEQADFVIMESTYGDKLHEQAGDVETQLAQVIHETAQRGGKVVIPTFALERAQELMYHISRLVHMKRIPLMKVFLDSPMAIDVTSIFLKFRDQFDEATLKLLDSNEPPLQFPGLEMTRTADQSKAINGVKQPCIIMASSGMCNAGRIKHHLRNNIERPEATILFVGHQGTGTLGRQILEGAKEVRIHGEMYRVRAHIAQIFGFSGHADRNGLLRWLSHLKTPPAKVFLTHGEERVSLALASYIETELRWTAQVPQYDEAVDLL